MGMDVMMMMMLMTMTMTMTMMMTMVMMMSLLLCHVLECHAMMTAGDASPQLQHSRGCR